MTADQFAVSLIASGLVAAALVGLLKSGRWRQCRSFLAYLAVVFVCELLVVLNQDVFYEAGFWRRKQLVYDVLKALVALEVCWRVFAVAPAVGRRAGAFATTLVVTTIVSVLLPPIGADPYLWALSELHPRSINGTIWLMVGTIALAQWYRIPVHPFHVALMTSFGLYLTIFGALLRLVAVYGWTARHYINAIDPLAYVALVAWWAHIAWRPEPRTVRVHRDTLERIKIVRVA